MIFIGYITKALGSIYVDEKMNKQTIDEVIKHRLSIEDKIPLLIFPEETNTSGRHILQFQNLAFKPVNNIKPLIVKSQDSCFSISQSPFSLIIHFILTQCFLFHIITICEYPVIKPTDYLFIKLGSEKREKYEVFKEATRNIYRDIGHLEQSDKTRRDKDIYISLIK